MKTLIMKMLCIFLCVALVCGVVTVSAQVDNNVGLEITFDKNIYVPGDIATVTLSLTDIEDEVMAQKELGVFEAHIEFDTDEMDFIATDDDTYELASQWYDGIIDDNDTNVFQVAQNPAYDYCIVLAFDKTESIPLECNTGGVFPIAKIRFMVNACTDGKLTVEFNNEQLDDGPVFPSVGAVITDGGVCEYNCTNGDAAEAEVKDFLIEDASAYIDENGNVFASFEAGSADGTAFLIVKLYHTETGMLAAPVRMFEFDGRREPGFEKIFTGVQIDGNYKLDIYLWDSGDNGIMGLKPLAQKVTANVVAIQ